MVVFGRCAPARNLSNNPARVAGFFVGVPDCVAQ
jgi:hypothetical protein